ncbi:MAG: precorrin-2 C(20)-methyltransferase [Clostridia bacterium]|nr:precorrin-2 C(20)-methyltransferase [Clostridia bacterium]
MKTYSNGKLYGIGVGPGDPELITVKAKKILEQVKYIAVPKTAADKRSLALTIAEGIVGAGKKILELLFPMSYDEKLLSESWNDAIVQIREKLDEGEDVAFITLGDPTVYSTYIYMHKVLKQQGYETEIIPGVTSFCASAARAGISLGENKETIAVIPSAYECENLEEILDTFDNVILMKVSKNFPKLKECLKNKGLLDKAVLVSRCGLPDESLELDVGAVESGKLSYFTTMIIKKSGVD